MLVRLQSEIGEGQEFVRVRVRVMVKVMVKVRVKVRFRRQKYLGFDP